MVLTREIAREARMSGSPEETRSFDFIEGYLRDLGYVVTRESFPSLVGFPIRASVEVVSPGPLSMKAHGYSLSPSTPPDGVTAALIDLGSAVEADYAKADIRGKVVLTNGLGTPEKQFALDRAGAAAHIHVDRDRIREMCVSPVWGTATPETAPLLPASPAVAVLGEEGDRLRALLEQGPVTVRIVSENYRGWCSIPVVCADLAGANDTFVLFSGHVDSWHFGAVDNASSNAIQLAVAKLLAGRRRELRRGIRLAFWSGHSHARYAGSTWYADTHWDELEERCVVHVNIDSAGAVGAELLTQAWTMAETYDFAARILDETVGEQLSYRRMLRAGDQSFWGIGVPSLFINPSEQATGGMGPSWHTPDDTLDTVDPDNLLRDARIYAAAVFELCSTRVLPFSYAAAVREMLAHARSAESAAAGRLDLETVVTKGEMLAADLDRLEAAAAADPETYNAVALELGHILVPVNYTLRGRFDQDIAMKMLPVPALATAAGLGAADPGSDAFHYELVYALRQRNRLASAFSAAQQAVTRALTVLGD
jgi:N-acetylated-alpha-linked acidic dipeptidase